jgi:triphosphoribosyl-dephospho-CoA synthetase
MRDLRKRLARLEAQWLRAVWRPIAAASGEDLDELIADARRFLALTDAEQDAEFAATIAQAEAEGNAEHVRILQEGWEAITSSR